MHPCRRRAGDEEDGTKDAPIRQAAILRANDPDSTVESKQNEPPAMPKARKRPKVCILSAAARISTLLRPREPPPQVLQAPWGFPFRDG